MQIAIAENDLEAARDHHSAAQDIFIQFSAARDLAQLQSVEV
jgi:hypothetical protein